MSKYVYSDFIPHELKGEGIFLTAGKRYKVMEEYNHSNDYKNYLAVIHDDNNIPRNIIVGVDLGCAYLDDKSWTVVIEEI